MMNSIPIFTGLLMLIASIMHKDDPAQPLPLQALSSSTNQHSTGFGCAAPLPAENTASDTAAQAGHISTDGQAHSLLNADGSPILVPKMKAVHGAQPSGSAGGRIACGLAVPMT